MDGLAIEQVLRSAMRARGWSIPRFAEECDVATGLAQKWVSPNPRNRAIPSPASCEKIAAALDLDPDYVLELAGHRKPRADAVPNPPRSVQQRHVDQEYDRWMAVMVPRMGIQAAHNAFWDPIVSDARARRETLERALYAPTEDAVYDADYRPQAHVNRRRREDDNADNRVLSHSELLWSNHVSKPVALLDRPA